MYQFINKKLYQSLNKDVLVQWYCIDHHNVSTKKNVPELDLTGSRPHRCSTLAIPLLLLHQQAELLYKNINNHLTTFGTKLNLRAHTNIRHYIIYAKKISIIFVAPRDVPTPSWRVSTVYIYIYVQYYTALNRFSGFLP